MKFVFTLLTCCLVLGLSAQQNYSSGWGNQEKVRGNGEVTSEDRAVAAFSGIQVCCSLVVEVRQGASQSVKVKAESNVLPYVETTVIGGRLEVGFKDNVNLKANEKIVVYVTVPELDYVSSSSSSSVISQSAFTGEELELKVSSSGFINFDFAGDMVRADASSGGRIELRGSGNNIKAAASSGAKVRAGDFTAVKGKASASSGGGVTVNVTDNLDAKASSGGGVRYQGEPASVSADKSSGGSVRKVF
jgi:hypothetical protein